jgi:ATP-dependent DNA helicase RecG
MTTLSDLLSRPESRTLDFKRQEVDLYKSLKTLVAFANTAGGTLVLGVADDGSPLGVEDVKAQEERYANAVSTNIEPPLDVDPEIVRHEGVDLLLVRVPRLPGPFYIRQDGPDKGVYVRMGSTNRRATKEQREELRRLARAQAFDERPCLGAAMEDLDLKAIDRAFGAVGRVPDGGALESLGLVTAAGSKRVPTNAGIILFGTASARSRYFSDAAFQCARFLGTDKVEFLDQLDPEGSVIDALDEVERFVRRNTRMAARIETTRRQNVPEYSTVQLREVLANAVAHTDYSQRGMNLRVAIFDDRLEVENPGGWPVGFSEEDFKAGISRPRNPAIARVLRELDVIERWGSGYRRIREASETGGYPIPDWHDMGPVLRVALYPHPAIVAPTAGGAYSATDDGTASGRATRTVTDTEETPLTERQGWMLLQLAQGHSVAAEDIMNQFHVSERTARRDIADLRERGLIAFEGPFKVGRYVLLRGGTDNDKP